MCKLSQMTVLLASLLRVLAFGVTTFGITQVEKIRV